MKKEEFDDMFSGQIPDYANQDWKYLKTGLELHDVKKTLSNVFWLIPGLTTLLVVSVIGFGYQIHQTNKKVIELENKLALVELERTKKSNLLEKEIPIADLRSQTDKKLQTEYLQNNISSISKKTNQETNQNTIYDQNFTLLSKSEVNLKTTKRVILGTPNTQTQIIAIKSNKPVDIFDSKSKEINSDLNLALNKTKKVDNTFLESGKSSASNIQKQDKTLKEVASISDLKNLNPTLEKAEILLETNKEDAKVSENVVQQTQSTQKENSPITLVEKNQILPQRTSLEEIAIIKKIDKKSTTNSSYSIGIFGGFTKAFGDEIQEPQGSTFGIKFLFPILAISNKSNLNLISEISQNSISFKLGNKEPRRFGIPIGNNPTQGQPNPDQVLIKTNIDEFRSVQFGLGFRYNYTMIKNLNLFSGVKWSFSKFQKSDIKFTYFDSKLGRTEEIKRPIEEKGSNASNFISPSFGANYIWGKHFALESEVFYGSQFKYYKELPNITGITFGINYKF